MKSLEKDRQVAGVALIFAVTSAPTQVNSQRTEDGQGSKRARSEPEVHWGTHDYYGRTSYYYETRSPAGGDEQNAEEQDLHNGEDYKIDQTVPLTGILSEKCTGNAYEDIKCKPVPCMNIESTINLSLLILMIISWALLICVCKYKQRKVVHWLRPAPDRRHISTQSPTTYTQVRGHAEGRFKPLPASQQGAFLDTKLGSQKQLLADRGYDGTDNKDIHAMYDIPMDD